MFEYIIVTSTITLVPLVLFLAAGYLLSEIFEGSGNYFSTPSTLLFCIMVLAGLAFVGLCNYASYDYGLVQERNKAAEAGVGSYRLDSKTGNTHFEYLEIKEEETNNE